MPTFIEKYKAAKQAIHPDKLVISGFIGMFAPAVVPLQFFLTKLVHEAGEQLPTEWMQIVAVAILGLANFASVKMEAKVLEEKLYSASIASTTGKVLFKNSTGIATAGHIASFAQVFVFNPAQFSNFAALQAGDGSRLFFENVIGVTLALSAWKLVLNAILLKFDSNILKVRIKKIYKLFRSGADASPTNDLDLLP